MFLKGQDDLPALAFFPTIFTLRVLSEQFAFKG
jgi:hypothetical protein